MPRLLLMYSNRAPTRSHVRRLEALREDVAVAVADSEESAIRYARDTDVILGHRYLWQVLPHTRRLAWVQSTAAGPYHLLTPELIRIKPVLTRCPIFSEIVALHALTSALALVRRIPEAASAQQRGEWAQTPFDMLPVPRTAMVVGVGSVGRALARLLRRHGIKVLGVTRRGTSVSPGDSDEWLSADDWREHLHRVDLCFVALPLNKRTVHFFDESALRRLPEHAVLVNVGQGRTVDTRALVRVLGEGHLGGAALDVIDPVPETHDDPVWTTPRLLITPKVAVFHPQRQRELESFMESQVRRFLDGEALLHVVDLAEAAEDK